MVTASAIATIEELAPGRLWAYFGTGFTARNSMGQRGMRWADLATYVTQVRQLLRGEVVEIDGSPCKMIHSPGWGPPRPIDVPLGLAPIGPKGMTVARELADGVILTATPAADDRQWSRIALLVTGTVLDDDEDYRSPRVREAIGPVYVTGYHAMWEWSRAAVVDAPGGAEWLACLEALPERLRHLGVHEGHLVEVSERDRPLLDAAGERLLGVGWNGSASEVSARVDAVGAQGVTEVVYQPAGDVRRELESFAAAVN
jgi:5,10-methylenetetrahydromethanopterin reductase